MAIFVPGDTVRTALGRGVVEEIRHHGRLLVLIGARRIVVDAADAAPVGAAVKSRRRAATTGQPDRAHEGDWDRRRAAADVDLHGLIVADALERVVSAIDAAIQAGHARVRVIHGRSGGRLRGALHRHLRELPSVRAFRLEPGNDGATIVEL
jgi:DNA mismatch repair protein MutS2